MRERDQNPTSTSIRSTPWVAQSTLRHVRRGTDPQSSQYSIIRITNIREVQLLQSRRLSVTFAGLPSFLTVKTEKKHADRRHHTGMHANNTSVACTSLPIMHDAIMCGVANTVVNMAGSASVCDRDRVLARDRALRAVMSGLSVRDTIK